MPVTCEPGATFNYALKCDRDKEPLPVFKIKALTVRESNKLIQESSVNVDKMDSLVELTEANIAMIKGLLVGWENMPIPFDFNELDNLLTRNELTELIYACIRQDVIEADKKK